MIHSQCTEICTTRLSLKLQPRLTGGVLSMFVIGGVSLAPRRFYILNNERRRHTTGNMVEQASGH